MAKSAVLTASGAAKGGSGSLWVVNVTKVGTGSSSVTIYDNPSAASGNILFQGDGLVQGSFQMTDGNGGPTLASQGMYVALAGTTTPTVVVVYD